MVKSPLAGPLALISGCSTWFHSPRPVGRFLLSLRGENLTNSFLLSYYIVFIRTLSPSAASRKCKH